MATLLEKALEKVVALPQDAHDAIASQILASLAPWAAGAFFVPSLALALGVWTESPRAFEAIYTVWWYVGPANKTAPLDYSGAWAADAGANGSR